MQQVKLADLLQLGIMCEFNPDKAGALRAIIIDIFNVT
jgi:hypothetical protein